MRYLIGNFNLKVRYCGFSVLSSLLVRGMFGFGSTVFRRKYITCMSVFRFQVVSETVSERCKI